MDTLVKNGFFPLVLVHSTPVQQRVLISLLLLLLLFLLLSLIYLFPFSFFANIHLIHLAKVNTYRAKVLVLLDAP